jgi:hypothetical protein
MTQNPGAVEDKINAITSGWAENASDATFYGRALMQFKAKAKPSLDARATIADLELQLAAARVTRDKADAATLEAVSNVVNSVKADVKHGEDGALYASFGYVRKSNRKSGLTRHVPLPAKPALVTPVILKAAA